MFVWLYNLFLGLSVVAPSLGFGSVSVLFTISRDIGISAQYFPIGFGKPSWAIE